jgi:hypothetical protein
MLLCHTPPILQGNMLWRLSEMSAFTMYESPCKMDETYSGSVTWSAVKHESSTLTYQRGGRDYRVLSMDVRKMAGEDSQ